LIKVPLTGNSKVNTPQIAGISLKTEGYNVTGNGERECLKTSEVGQSAAKTLGDESKVQRLSERSRAYDR